MISIFQEQCEEERVRLQLSIMKVFSAHPSFAKRRDKVRDAVYLTKESYTPIKMPINVPYTLNFPHKLPKYGFWKQHFLQSTNKMQNTTLGALFGRQCTVGLYIVSPIWQIPFADLNTDYHMTLHNSIADKHTQWLENPLAKGLPHIKTIAISFGPTRM